MTPIHLAHHTVSCCAGDGLAPLRAALRNGSSGLRPHHIDGLGIDTWIGEVPGLDAAALPGLMAGFDCRNNRLARRGLAADGFEDAVRSRVARYGARRVGVVLGTSTSGILSTELAYRQRPPEGGPLPAGLNYPGTHSTYSLADFVRTWLAIEGPACVVSTACSSSAKAYATAARLIHAGLIDAAVVGGVDSLCFTTLHGFASLELTSADPCRPYDAARSGISIGEAAAFGLLERTTDSLDADAVLLLGYGESSDAYHMSSPHPEGLGARLAMEGALARAGLSPADIDYINLHGTATHNNDAAEGYAVAGLFGSQVAASSTKGITGHTLGAAGALEISISAVAMADGLLPGSVHTRSPDPSIPIDYVLTSRSAPLRHVMSNSFGFGGSNCSVILGRAG